MPMGRGLGGVVAAAVIALGLAACQPPPAQPYDVAVFGDVPYSESLEANYDRMIADINSRNMAFSTHVGDYKDADSPCTEAVLNENVVRFDSFDDPLVYTPGDNEWLDCSDELFWLGRIREVVFRGTGTQSRGRAPMALTSQASAGYPENARWTRAGVTFATLHVVGNGDNQGSLEGRARRAADIAWLQAAFRAARDAGHRGVVILAQDSPFNGDGSVPSSMSDLMLALRTETQSFSGSVLWIQGDGHSYRNDQPMRTSSGAVVQNFRRVQVEGDSRVSYVRLHVDPTANPIFSITLSPRFCPTGPCTT
jgi:hypothetical protein